MAGLLTYLLGRSLYRGISLRSNVGEKTVQNVTPKKWNFVVCFRRNKRTKVQPMVPEIHQLTMGPHHRRESFEIGEHSINSEAQGVCLIFPKGAERRPVDALQVSKITVVNGKDVSCRTINPKKDFSTA